MALFQNYCTNSTNRLIQSFRQNKSDMDIHQFLQLVSWHLSVEHRSSSGIALCPQPGAEKEAAAPELARYQSVFLPSPSSLSGTQIHLSALYIWKSLLPSYLKLCVYSVMSTTDWLHSINSSSPVV